MTEELGERIRDVELVGVLENRFLYSGASGHELVFVFDFAFEDPAVYERSRLKVRTNKGERVARWYPVDSLAAGDPPVYPAGLLELLKRDSWACDDQ